MLRVRTIERAEELAQVRELWHELARRARATRAESSSTLFQSYELNEVAARVFAGRERPHVVVAESDSAAVIIPAYMRADSVSLLGEELFDYRGVLGSDERLLTRAWDEVARVGRPLVIKAVRGAETLGFRAEVFAGAPYRRAHVPLRRNKDIERNWRQMCAQGFVDRVISGSAGRAIENQVRRMYALKGRHESGSLFRDALRVEAVAEMTAAWTSELHVIERDGELVAAVLMFIDGNVCRFYGTYYDARWARYSPGMALLYRAIQRAQERGLDFDLMTGEQPYKLRFATEVAPLWTVHGFEREVVAA